MTMEMAEARGTVTVRPWRVGLLVDTRSPVEVREAIASLSSVWGGRSMPIFDINTPIPELEKLGEVFGVDSLYAEVTEGPLAEFLRKPGWAWQGRAQWGPFGSEDNGTFRKGLLPIQELLHEPSQLTVPCWSAEDPDDLAFAAIWGLPDKVGTHHDPVPYTDLFTTRPASMVGLGILATTMLHIHPDRPNSRGSQDGIFILHAEQSENIVKFWNMRAVGGSVLGIPSDAAPELADALLNQPLPGSEMGVVGPQGVVSKRNVLHVFGGAKSSIEVTKAIERAAGATHEVREGRPQEPQFLFGGLRTDFRRTLRVEFRPASQGIDVDLPRLPLVSKPSHVFRRGIVAAEVELGEVRGQDPRYTGHVPPYRRHAALLENRQRHQSVDHVRSGHDGLVFGLDVGYEELHVPFANTQEVIRLLFDSESVEVGQSNVGKFQTRAAEKFGGPYSGTFNQPGVRAAVTRAAGKPAGVPLDYLRGMVEKERGSWPDSPMNHSMAPRDYAIRAVNNLFHSGLFVPTLRVHCSHCRVESHVSADDLGTTMNCEFCGQVYNLALSQALSQPEWRYRLAAHLQDSGHRPGVSRWLPRDAGVFLGGGLLILPRMR